MLINNKVKLLLKENGKVCNMTYFKYLTWGVPKKCYDSVEAEMEKENQEEFL